MSESSAAAGKYSMPRVYSYIRKVEVAYGVSLKFWLDLREDSTGEPALSVFSWGSGDAFDLIPEGIQPYPSVIYSDEENALGEALFFAVLFVARCLGKVKEPLGPPPTL